MTLGLARKLSRAKPHRDALLRNLVTQLFQHEAIVTSQAKCKEVSSLAERVITWAKRAAASDNPGRYSSNVQANLSLAGDNRHLMTKVLTELPHRYTNRQGGYTRVMNMEPRQGDKSHQALIELVDSPVLSPSQPQNGSNNNNNNTTLRRGNMKFWLLMKTLVNDDFNRTPHSNITMLNLFKMYKPRQDDPAKLQTFKHEITAVRRLLIQHTLDCTPSVKESHFSEKKEAHRVEQLITALNKLNKNPKPKSAKPKHNSYKLVPRRTLQLEAAP